MFPMPFSLEQIHVRTQGQLCTSFHRIRGLNENGTLQRTITILLAPITWENDSGSINNKQLVIMCEYRAVLLIFLKRVPKMLLILGVISALSVS